MLLGIQKSQFIQEVRVFQLNYLLLMSFQFCFLKSTMKAMFITKKDVAKSWNSIDYCQAPT